MTRGILRRSTSTTSHLFLSFYFLKNKNLYAPLNAADDIAWPQHQGEGHQVAEQETGEQDVGQLPASGLDHGGVVVAREHAGHEEGDEAAGQRKAHGADGPGAAGAQEVLGDLETELVVVVGLGAQGADLAEGLVLQLPDLEEGRQFGLKDCVTEVIGTII